MLLPSGIEGEAVGEIVSCAKSTPAKFSNSNKIKFFRIMF